MTTISAIPQTHGELIKHRIREEGTFPRTKFIAVFIYPDCVREFDGTHWTVYAGATGQLAPLFGSRPNAIVIDDQYNN